MPAPSPDLRLVTQTFGDSRYETPSGAQTKVIAAINALIDSAPGTLDTLGEIAARLATDESAAAAILATLTAHTGNTSNPHSTTKAQVGLGNADNTADAAKPISTATQTALDAKRNVLLPAPAAGYFFPLSQTTNNTMATAQGDLRLTPWLVEKAVSLTRIGCEVVTIGDVGSKVRLGIYADNGACYPGTLVLDAGQIAGDSATVQELTITQTLQPGLYWIGAAAQSVTTTAPVLRGCSNWEPPVRISAATAPAANTSLHSYRQASVTAALPSTFTSTVDARGSVARLHMKAV